MGERVIIRLKDDHTFRRGMLDLAVNDDGKLMILANRGFELLVVERAESIEWNSKITEKPEE